MADCLTETELLYWPDQDPSERLDYGMNWTPRRIDADTISVISAAVTQGTVSVTAAVGPVQGARSGQGTVHIITGGVDGEVALIKLFITTSSGRILDQTVQITIKAR